ncbi:30S ribosomal protein S16 [Patescibacteria group bacterium]|nr:30S ribosomal protein S16 [Patescibacteria group bacterium]
MLTIRLSRVGKKNIPLYRVIISEKHKDLYGDCLEILGSYNPHTKELKINVEKTKYWISMGAGISNTVNNLLIEKKIIEGKKLKASKNRKSKKTPAPVSVASTTVVATPAPAKTEVAPIPAQAETMPASVAEPKTEQSAV